jgi:hypothetical protein
MICLAKTKEIAQERIQVMDAILSSFEEETNGCF